MLVAAVMGLITAAAVSFLVGRSAGVDIGLAAFALSWTAVALFVLGVRFVYRQLVPAATAEPQEQARAAAGRRSERNRRRRKRR